MLSHFLTNPSQLLCGIKKIWAFLSNAAWNSPQSHPSSNTTPRLSAILIQVRLQLVQPLLTDHRRQLTWSELEVYCCKQTKCTNNAIRRRGNDAVRRTSPGCFHREKQTYYCNGWKTNVLLKLRGFANRNRSTTWSTTTSKTALPIPTEVKRAFVEGVEILLLIMQTTLSRYFSHIFGKLHCRANAITK